jgi:large subunit ribosomal protein L18
VSNTKIAKKMRLARHARLRKYLKGVPDKPRLSVFRSLNHVYVQVIDDSQGTTLVSASSLEDEVRQQTQGKNKTDVSKLVGGLVASRAKGKGVETVVFDRGGHKYHGRVAAVADAAREGGLKF